MEKFIYQLGYTVDDKNVIYMTLRDVDLKTKTIYKHYIIQMPKHCKKEQIINQKRF